MLELAMLDLLLEENDEFRFDQETMLIILKKCQKK
jgi:hypothetical protein